MNLWLMGLLAAAFAALAGAGATDWWDEAPKATKAGTEPAPATSEASRSEDPPARRKVSVTPPVLQKWYEENEIAADNLLKGRELEIPCRLASINKDPSGHVVLRLDPPEESVVDDALGLFRRVTERDEAPKVIATLKDSETDKAATMRRNKWVVLTCIGNGLQHGVPALRDCTIHLY